MRRPRILVLLLCCLFTAVASGDVITGRVLDAARNPIGGATIALVDAGLRTATTVTDPDGRFSFDSIATGSYVVQVMRDDVVRMERNVEATADAVSIEIALPDVAEEITIMGARIAPRPDTIPGAVTILGREVFESTNPATLTEVLRKAAGVNVRDEEGFSLRPNIGIRGLNPTRSSKVLLLEDGLPFTYAPYGDNASYYHPPMERFESIEVLKGSGQIAFGPSTVGGVINYITPNPPAHQETRLKLVGGNREFLNAHLGWGGTWGNTGILVDLMRKQGNGARENLSSELNDVNAKVVRQLTPRQSLTVRANYYGEESNVTYSGLRLDEWNADPKQNPFDNDYFYGDRYGLGIVHRFDLGKTTQLSTSVYASNFKRHWWRQSSNSAQRPNDASDPKCGSMANLDSSCGNEGRLREYTNWGVEPRLNWNRSFGSIRSEMQVGVRAHFEDQERLQVNGDTPAARSGRTVENNARNNTAFSFFVQDRLTFGRFSVTPGVRLEQVDFERTNRLANSGAGASGDTSLTQVVPGVGVSYDAGSVTAFAGVHRGFAPPRTEDIISDAGGVIELDPELSWNSEVGLRLQPRAGLQFESTLFRMDYENQIVPASLAGGVGATLTNAGETLHQGLELSGRIDSAGTLGTAHNAYATLAYTFVDEAKFVGTRYSGVSGSGNVLITGNRLPYAPEHLLTAGLGYVLPSGIEAYVEAAHVGEQFGDDLNTVASTVDGQRGLLPSYTIYNATVNYPVPAMNATLFASIKNLTDELYIADRSRGMIPGSPRLVQFGFAFKR